MVEKGMCYIVFILEVNFLRYIIVWSYILLCVIGVKHWRDMCVYAHTYKLGKNFLMWKI